MRWKHRYSVLVILFAASTLCYLDRMAMASAIPFIARDFQLSPTTMGAVLSAFFIGYASMQIPGGLLADRFGPRPVLTAGITWWSIMTAATGLTSGLSGLLAVRLLFGLGEGPYPPAASKALSVWFPPRELGNANGLYLAASGLGATIAPLVVVGLIAKWGWRSVFYWLSVPGFLVGLFVWVYIRNSPAHSPHVTQQERSDVPPPPVDRTPIGSALRHSLATPSVLLCAASLFFTNLVNWGLMNWLPTYLLDARGFALDAMGSRAAAANFAGAIGAAAGGYFCHKFASKLYIPIVLGLSVSAALIYVAAIAPTGNTAVAALALVLFFENFACTAIFTLPMVTVPKHAVGGAFGIVNSAGQLAGVIAPVTVGALLDATNRNFYVVLLVMAGLTVAAIIPALKIRQVPALSPTPSAV